MNINKDDFFRILHLTTMGGGGGRGEGGWQFSIFSVKMKQMWGTSTILSGDLPN